MGHGEPLTEMEKAKIATLKDYMIMSNQKIAKEINQSEKIVRNFLENRENYGKNCVTGRLSTISPAQKQHLIRSAANSNKSARDIKLENNLTIGVRRTQKILSGCSYLKYKKVMRKPMLTSNNIEGR
ncbi:unnamed protein product [Hermetia illucens]|uniref:Tc3 transposase DNA binding domain-containing protein n=1 Tax=Hermetia illucens TaxID=343691 RepID=A0A7R8YY85_HERIL|nr:unnamed protein product [Hermetia illucens]